MDIVLCISHKNIFHDNSCKFTLHLIQCCGISISRNLTTFSQISQNFSQLCELQNLKCGENCVGHSAHSTLHTYAATQTHKQSQTADTNILRQNTQHTPHAHTPTNTHLQYTLTPHPQTAAISLH